MPRLLEDLQAGTPVHGSDGSLAGEIRGVYASGQAQGAEFLLVFWSDRGEEALIGADEVMTIGEDGVSLRSSTGSYRNLPAFDPRHNPLLHRLG